MNTTISPDSIVLHSPAKVNFALSVGAPRPSDGYHPIASWMVAINFCDTLTLTKQATGTCDFQIRFAVDAPVSQPIDWPIEKDLAYRAWQLVQAHTGLTLPVCASIEKRIPAGAGLAGGSGNAAAMIVGLNRLFALDISKKDQHFIAMKLGCDVAFVLASMTGQPSALVTGVGDQLENLPTATKQSLVLILPTFGCPTGQVYAAFDELIDTDPCIADEMRVRDLTAQSPIDPTQLFNDLAEPACVAQPKLAQTLVHLREYIDKPIHVTGSGAAMFVLTASEQEASSLCKTICTQTGIAALATHSLH